MFLRSLSFRYTLAWLDSILGGEKDLLPIKFSFNEVLGCVDTIKASLHSVETDINRSQTVAEYAWLVEYRSRLG